MVQNYILLKNHKRVRSKIYSKIKRVGSKNIFDSQKSYIKRVLL